MSILSDKPRDSVELTNLNRNQLLSMGFLLNSSLTVLDHFQCTKLTPRSADEASFYDANLISLSHYIDGYSG